MLKQTTPTRWRRAPVVALAAALLVAACSSADTPATSSVAIGLDTAEPTPVPTTPPVTLPTVTPPADASAEDTSQNDESTNATVEDVDTDQTHDDSAEGATLSFTAEVWADNWFALYINGVLVGEDSVPITTERSFNMETISFEAPYPFTVAIEAKDFKETDSGIEYIGAQNQQMGDGGIIVQITDVATGSVIAVSDGSWATYVAHRAPLNKECEKDTDPDSTCLFEINDAPAGWETHGFDDAGWAAATEWSEADVSPKDGYDQVDWDSTARLVWGDDLEVDNTILLRATVAG